MDAVTGIGGEIHTHGRVKRLGGFHQSEISGRFHLVVFPWQQSHPCVWQSHSPSASSGSPARAAHQSKDLDHDRSHRFRTGRAITANRVAQPPRLGVGRSGLILAGNERRVRPRIPMRLDRLGIHNPPHHLDRVPTDQEQSTPYEPSNGRSCALKARLRQNRHSNQNTCIIARTESPISCIVNMNDHIKEVKRRDSQLDLLN